MTTLWVVWVVSAVVIVVAAAAAGQGINGKLGGLLIDDRGRYSLSRFQLLWWFVIILSLVAGVAAGRFTATNVGLLGFSIPGPVIALITTAGATTVAATGIKSYKNRWRQDQISASLPGAGFLAQLLLTEEGAGADQTLDIGKFQSLIVTVLLGLVYVAGAVHDFLGRGTVAIKQPSDITALPSLGPTFVALLGVSMAGYLGGKLVNRAGVPATSLATRNKVIADQLDADRNAGLPMDARSIRRRQKGATASAGRRIAPGDNPP